MAQNKVDLLNLDVEKLFEEHNIDYITDIDKSLDVEIEKKRSELRSMVGDRYKDVLAASDAIKSMKLISENIVANIGKITDTCENLLKHPPDIKKTETKISPEKLQIRALVIQIRLVILLNEEIWMALDKDSNLEAAQFYLLALHIHTGLSLTKKEHLERISLLKEIRETLNYLRSEIFERVTKKLESVEITAEESSSNLSALILLQNKSSSELFNIFIEHRKTALSTVVNEPHNNVRLQITAMVRCLITTIKLLHDCFISTSKGSEKGLIWQQLEEIVGEKATPTLDKINLPLSPLIKYIPEIVKHFKPKCVIKHEGNTISKDTVEQWLKNMQQLVKNGLEKSLQLIVNIKGLFVVREEVFKIELPEDWSEICINTHLPQNFSIWHHFFQELVSQRTKSLISSKLTENINESNKELQYLLAKGNESCNLIETVWVEDENDVSRSSNNHDGLSMKAKGFSSSIVVVCKKIDDMFLQLLQDVSQYLYGQEFKENVILVSLKDKFKFPDREQLEHHLRVECVSQTVKITGFVLEEVQSNVEKCLLASRALRGIIELCSHLNFCCTFNSSTGDDWLKVCDNFSKASQSLLENWIQYCVETTAQELQPLSSITPKTMLKYLLKWDIIEIQEQTDEKVFKSQIKVPLKPSLILNNIFVKLNNDLTNVLPHTLPKAIHLQFVEKNVQTILREYCKLSKNEDINQIQALQFLFDVKFLTTFCIARENLKLSSQAQEVCDNFRGRIDPFDLDVFYSYLQNNVKKSVIQSQTIWGCLLPSSSQLANLGIHEKQEMEKVPSLLALSVPSSNSWFSLLPITVPSQKVPAAPLQTQKETKVSKSSKSTRSSADIPSSTALRSSAVSILGGLTSDWFS